MIHSPSKNRRAFTLIELMVAVSLLVLVILAVGHIFRDASKAVGLSQVSMEMFSNVRGVQQQVENDVQKMDRRGFLVIRGRWQGQGWTSGSSYLAGDHVVNLNVGYRCIADVNGSQAPGSDTSHWSVSRDRADQISFLANGTFPNHTGSLYSSGNTGSVDLIDAINTNAALVHYGHLIREGPGTAYGSFLNSGARQDLAAPAGVADWPSQVPLDRNDQDLVLGRNTIVFCPGYQTSTVRVDFPSRPNISASWSPAYGDVRMVSNYVGTNPSDPFVSLIVSMGGTNPSESSAHIASSRIDISYWSPDQLMAAVAYGINARGGRTGTVLRYEADTLCYRFKTVPNAYATEFGSTNIANGTIRMQPVILQACPNFSVEWTDGFVYQAGDPVYGAGHYQNGVQIQPGDVRIGQLRWYGLDEWKNPRGNDSDPTSSGNATTAVNEPPLGSNDNYTAIFSFDSRASWPVALKFTYRVTDTNNRLQGGRTLTQIVRLPD